MMNGKDDFKFISDKVYNCLPDDRFKQFKFSGLEIMEKNSEGVLEPINPASVGFYGAERLRYELDTEDVGYRCIVKFRGKEYQVNKDENGLSVAGLHGVKALNVRDSQALHDMVKEMAKVCVTRCGNGVIQAAPEGRRKVIEPIFKSDR